jgi:hypothetical protein
MSAENQPQPSPDERLTDAPLIEGPRKVGAYPLPSGAIVSHEMTNDGMKQTRVHGSAYRSAAEFHAAHGTATPGELDKVNRSKQ